MALKPTQFLMIPGPTPVPPSILETVARHPLGHRSTEMSAIVADVTKQLKELGETEADALLLTGSGTMAMDAAISNTINPGDKVLCLITGVFGERWAKIAQAFGAQVERFESMPGKPVDVDQLASILAKDKEQSIKVVTLTHNETSTGVMNDLRQITHLIRKHGALSVVDAVTSFGAVRIPIDEWMIDVLITGSQKALMLPPGLAIVFFGQRAWTAQSTSKIPKFYSDLARYKKSSSANTTPFTPNVSLICGLQKSLQLIKEEGIAEVQKRHLTLKTILRSGLRSMGLQLFVDDDSASPTITSILSPEKITVSDIRKGLKDDYNIIVADGQEDLQGKIFRIGHMGYVFERDIVMTLGCLEATLKKLGHSTNNAQTASSSVLQTASRKK